jgi:hypothetical protein
MTPEQEEQVRRALADAAVARTPMPPEVAGRLDGVLAELVTARQQGSPTEDAGATGERRARRWSAVLVAAAVVCLVALVAPAVLRAVSSGDSGSASSAGAASTAAEGRGSATGTPSAPAAPSAGPSRALAQGVLPPPRLHRATLQRDVRRALAAVPALASGSTGLTERQNRRTGCKTPPPAGDTDVVAVLLDGKPATLVVAPPRQGMRQARVYSCEDVSAPVATARVAAP